MKLALASLRRLLAVTLTAALPGSTGAIAQTSDAPGSADHPMVSRYTGSFIDGYAVDEFDEYRLALGPAVWNQDNSARIPQDAATLQGRITRILYRGPQERSTLEILKNYQSALESGGFEILFTCGSDCGNNFSSLLYGPMDMRIDSSDTSGSAFDLPQDVRYLAARFQDSERTVHIALLTAFDNGFSALSKTPVTLLEIIEAETMETGMVTVDADAIARGIDNTGHMAIYGVLFDTGSATIKPESAAVLGEIAKLLELRIDLNLLVVGHTDNQGDYEMNMNLSSARANSVARYLSANHGIAPARLQSAGVGYLAPVASNDTPQGRAMNRRVELVKNK